MHQICGGELQMTDSHMDKCEVELQSRKWWLWLRRKDQDGQGVNIFACEEESGERCWIGGYFYN